MMEVPLPTCSIKSFIFFLIILAFFLALSWYLSLMFCLCVCFALPIWRTNLLKAHRVWKCSSALSLSVEHPFSSDSSKKDTTGTPIRCLVMIQSLKISPINKEASSELMELGLKRLLLFFDKCTKNHCQILSLIQSLEVPQRILFPPLLLHLHNCWPSWFIEPDTYFVSRIIFF